MKHGREFWAKHVESWRVSGLTQAQYCRRHRLLKGTLGYWSSTLSERTRAASTLVEVGRAPVRPELRGAPIELVVKRRYLLRLWPGMEPEHLRDVLLVLEAQA